MATQQQPQDFTVCCDSDSGPRRIWAIAVTAEEAAVYVEDVFSNPELGRWINVLRVEEKATGGVRTNAALFHGLSKKR